MILSTLFPKVRCSSLGFVAAMAQETVSGFISKLVREVFSKDTLTSSSLSGKGAGILKLDEEKVQAIIGLFLFYFNYLMI